LPFLDHLPYGLVANLQFVEGLKWERNVAIKMGENAQDFAGGIYEIVN